MRDGQEWDKLPQELLVDLAQLTKANSIEGNASHHITSPRGSVPADPHDAGNKKDNITIIYTPWANLKKDGSMDVGQVSFKDHRQVGGSS